MHRGPIARLLLVASFAFVAMTTFLVVEAASAQPERRAAPSLEGGLAWINTERPLTLEDDLRGHVVLVDFWTYCCINCIHILPDLEYLEEKYADEPFVVIGVHSAKFDEEGKPQNVRQAAARYDIKHPVIVDDEFAIWRRYGARAWPTLALIDTQGRFVGRLSGEGHRETLDKAIAALLEEAREDGTLAETKVTIGPDPKAIAVDGSTLRFPGKVLALSDADFPGEGGRLFMADSSNDRVIEATLPDASGRSRVVRTFGAAGERGRADGVGDAARFNDPQGLAYDARTNTLYVADNKNHLLRKIDLESGRVSTLAGTGERGYDRRGGKVGTEQAIASPWAVTLSPDGSRVFIAMAGTHQLWSYEIETGKTRAIAGSGAENIYDDDALDAALAQPSGLALSADGSKLYFADTEGSAIRYLDLEHDKVITVIGRAVEDPLADSSLFDFGDVDGPSARARLQHAIGIVRLPSDAGERFLIADTYNSKLKVLDTDRRTIETWSSDSLASLGLDEPAGLSVADIAGKAAVFVADTNNHRIIMLDIGSGAGRVVELVGLDQGVQD